MRLSSIKINATITRKLYTPKTYEILCDSTRKPTSHNSLSTEMSDAIYQIKDHYAYNHIFLPPENASTFLELPSKI